MKRREFLTSLGLGAAGMMIPAVPSYAKGLMPEELSDAVKPTSANDKVNVAFIGLGQQAMGLLNSFMKIPVVWNPIVQKFKNDPEAQKMTAYDYRNGYDLNID